jgi:hypothetical protein
VDDEAECVVPPWAQRVAVCRRIGGYA